MEFSSFVGLLFLVSFTLVTREGATETCTWKDRPKIALQQLKTPAQVLREYSDVTSSRDCYQKCCDLEDEGCNVAVFMYYDTEIVCMNVKCEPFDSCVWSNFTTSVAAVINRASNSVNYSLDSINLNDGTIKTTAAPATINTTESEVSGTSIAPGSNTNESVTIGNEINNTPETVTVQTFGPTTNKDNIIPGNDINPDLDTNNPFNSNTNPPMNGNDANGGVGEGNFANDNDISDNNGGTSNNLTVYEMGGEDQHVNYTVSITIGVLTCAAFLAIMYVAARRFNLFQDRSKYSRLLENPEQYADNYSTSDFED